MANIYITEKEFKADKAHSINELKALLPGYLKGSDELGYSSNMRDPLEFLTDLIKE